MKETKITTRGEGAAAVGSSGKRIDENSKNNSSNARGRPEKPSYKQFFESEDEASNDKSKKSQKPLPKSRVTRKVLSDSDEEEESELSKAVVEDEEQIENS